MSSVRVLVTDPRQPEAAALIAELTAELSTRYPELNDNDGAFKPEDVLVPRAVFVVAWLDEVAVGCGALRPMSDPDTSEIKRMYVRPAARGKGVSRSILTELETQARQFGYRKLMLETGIRQPEAIGLYAAFGYAQIACYDAYGDEPLSVCFEKRL